MPDCTAEQAALDAAQAAIPGLLASYLIDEAALVTARNNFDISEQSLADGVIAVVQAQMDLDDCESGEQAVRLADSYGSRNERMLKLINVFCKSLSAIKVGR